MQKWKTALIILGITITLSVVLYFIPWDRILGNLPVLKNFYNNTTLEIITKNCRAEVSINGKVKGETPLTLNDLPEGKYEVTLTRVETEDSFYKPQIFNIELTRNTVSRIEMEIGPNGINHGYTMHYRSVPTTNKKGLLTVTSDTQDAKIFIDGEYVKALPVTDYSVNNTQYQLKLTAEGYENLEMPIIIREGYQLNIRTYLLPIPLSLEELPNE